MDSFKFLEPYAKRPDQRFHMAGVGLNEWMNPEIIHRPNGTWDWLFMFFHTPVKIEVDGQVVDCPEDTLMVWDDTQSHYYGTIKERWRHSWIHCQGAVVLDYLVEAGLTTGVYPAIQLNELLEHYLPQIHDERLRSDMDPIILESLFKCLLREIGRIHKPMVQTIPPRIRELKQYMDSRFAAQLSLNALAKRAAMSKPHLISEFRKHIGTSPIDYLISVRLGHAQSLLLNRNLPVGEVAERVGYSDIYHFSKIFKKHMGHSPSAFRGKK